MDRNTIIKTLEDKLCAFKVERVTGKLCLEINLFQGGIAKAYFTVKNEASLTQKENFLDKRIQ